MGVLALNEEVLRDITAAVERARKKPIPWEVLKSRAVDDPAPYLKLADRKPGLRPTPEMVDVPVGYRLNISFEVQPAGLCEHISVSSPDPVNNVPNEHAMAMLGRRVRHAMAAGTAFAAFGSKTSSTGRWSARRSTSSKSSTWKSSNERRPAFDDGLSSRHRAEVRRLSIVLQACAGARQLGRASQARQHPVPVSAPRQGMHDLRRGSLGRARTIRAGGCLASTPPTCRARIARTTSSTRCPTSCAWSTTRTGELQQNIEVVQVWVDPGLPGRAPRPGASALPVAPGRRRHRRD